MLQSKKGISKLRNASIQHLQVRKSLMGVGELGNLARLARKPQFSRPCRSTVNRFALSMPAQCYARLLGEAGEHSTQMDAYNGTTERSIEVARSVGNDGSTSMYLCATSLVKISFRRM